MRNLNAVLAEQDHVNASSTDDTLLDCAHPSGQHLKTLDDTLDVQQRGRHNGQGVLVRAQGIDQDNRESYEASSIRTNHKLRDLDALKLCLLGQTIGHLSKTGALPGAKMQSS
ncbi:unannotated protein [freshwater metagenome]|uniref:Unannotated protein n=1 Tax=freshwater metagenome TaxID=449393 RepID=A0A6J6BXE6_9ZZZZ